MRLPMLDEWLCLGPVREEVYRKAATLLSLDDRTAYSLARNESRRLRGDARLARFWSRVAREIGSTGADRYPG